ncbi:MAG: M36 family metallopeptidase [Pseudomonadota bacterium]
MKRWFVFWMLCLLCKVAFAAESFTGEHYLTGTSSDDPLNICRDHLQSTRNDKGLAAPDIADLAISNRYVDKHSGVTHLYFRQRLGGIDIEGASYSASVDTQGRLITEGDRLKRGLPANALAATAARLSAAEAISSAAAHLQLSQSAAITTLTAPAGIERRGVYRAPDISRNDIPAKLAYVQRGDAFLLAWNLVIRTPDGRDWWDMYVDAESGAVLRKINWMVRDSYNVVPLPFESPSESPRLVVLNAATATASPFGWHDTNGIAGAEFTDTRGNNVEAQEDSDANDTGGARPDGGPSLIFNPPLNPQLQPSANQDAATANLFYWNNILHDVLYEYGFDEAAGNFQTNNYGNGGAGSDPVFADSQDGSSLNNAQFGTPPDGFAGVMEMFLFSPSTVPSLTVSAPAGIAGAYAASDGAFGAWTDGLAGSVVQALDPADGAGPTTTDGCSALTNAGAIAGNIALVDRGTCTFVTKTANVQAAGAVAIIIVNNAGDALVNMAGQDPTLSIPPVFIGQSDGNTIKAQLGTGVVASVVAGETRDASFDNGIIAHEYGHGLSTRLTGGPANVGCLSTTQPRGMGEGWSDWLGLMMVAKASDSAIVSKPIGTYALGQSISSAGIRNFPYNRDLGVNPLTFVDINILNQPHGIGEVWAAALWDLYWNLVDEYGFDSDLYSGTGGNNLLMQLVIDAMKLQPCSPTFLQARDALLSADLATNSGANQCLIWEAFARRGIGLSATSPANSDLLGVAEAFDEPASCAIECGNGTQEAGEQCDDGNTVFFDGCAGNCRVESQLADIEGTASGGNITLVIDGVAVNVTTSPGDTPGQVATAIAAAINASTTLDALYGGAAAQGGGVAYAGNLDSITINDAGLSLVEAAANAAQQIPIQWLALLLGAVFLTLVGASKIARHV